MIYLISYNIFNPILWHISYATFNAGHKSVKIYRKSFIILNSYRGALKLYILSVLFYFLLSSFWRIYNNFVVTVVVVLLLPANWSRTSALTRDTFNTAIYIMPMKYICTVCDFVNNNFPSSRFSLRLVSFLYANEKAGKTLLLLVNSLE